MQQQHNITILGGGFAGVRCAKVLAQQHLPQGTTIRLISDRPHFEYHGALYRIVAGHSPLEVCLPLRDILPQRRVDIIQDRVTRITPEQNTLVGASGTTYRYDTLVIALGAETVFFDVPGLQERAHGIKTIAHALRLKNHLHKTLEDCAHGDTQTKVCGGNIVVIGGGATGVEIAAELAVYTKETAKKHDVDPSLMQVSLMEAQPHILSTLPRAFTERIEQKIRSLGVNIFTHRAVTEQEAETVLLKDMDMKTKTVVWTAGVRAHQLLQDAGLEVDRGGRAVVCAHLKAKGHNNIFVAGDSASTSLAGMAQTALQDGGYIARTIARSLRGQKPRTYKPLTPIYAIPAGPGWAGAYWKGIAVYGRLGWAVRRLVDLVVYLSLLPLRHVPAAFAADGRVSETCPACTHVP